MTGNEARIGDRNTGRRYRNRASITSTNTIINKFTRWDYVWRTSSDAEWCGAIFEGNTNDGDGAFCYV